MSGDTDWPKHIFNPITGGLVLVIVAAFGWHYNKITDIANNNQVSIAQILHSVDETVTESFQREFVPIAQHLQTLEEKIATIPDIEIMTAEMERELDENLAIFSSAAADARSVGYVQTSLAVAEMKDGIDAMLQQLSGLETSVVALEASLETMESTVVDLSESAVAANVALDGATTATDEVAKKFRGFAERLKLESSPPTKNGTPGDKPDSRKNGFGPNLEGFDYCESKAYSTAVRLQYIQVRDDRIRQPIRDLARHKVAWHVLVSYECKTVFIFVRSQEGFPAQATNALSNLKQMMRAEVVQIEESSFFSRDRGY